MKLERRSFLGGVAALVAAGKPSVSSAANAAVGRTSAAADELRRHPIPFADVDPYTEDMDGAWWWKGDTHMHTFLSDGTAFPIEAAALYRRFGYDFIVQTDHDVTTPRDELWLNVHRRPGITAAHVARLRRHFPDLVPECRKNAEGVDEYRIASYAELSARMNAKNRFLVIPGNEVTFLAKNGENLHCTLLNVLEPCQARRQLADVPACFDFMISERDRIIPADDPGLSALAVCHPLWNAYDVLPAMVIAHPSIRFFEVNNSGSMVRYGPLPPGDTFTHDKWWDVVNATRATLGQPLIYGTACDDKHVYDRHYDGSASGLGYVRVAAKELTTPAIMRALHKGNFYASSGLELSQLSFDRAKNTLTVAVRARPGHRYKVVFIGSKRGCETDAKGTVKWTVEGLTKGDIKFGYSPHREAPYYSPSIGMTLKTQIVTTKPATYTMQPDDLYVRAKIVTEMGVRPETLVQEYPIAWTQPILNRRG